MVYDKKSSTSYVVKSWNMSNVLYAPHNLSCASKYLNGINVRVTCSTTKVFPGISCQLFQIHNGQDSLVSSADFSYSSEPGNDGYNYASCTSVVSVTTPGDYKYMVRIYLGNLPNEWTRNEITNEVKVKGIPQVVIEPSLCPVNRESVSFKCAVFWVNVTVQFSWFLGGANITEAQKAGYFISGSKNVSYIEIQNPKSHQGKLLMCVARYGHTTTNDTKLLDHAVLPPKLPFFKQKDVPVPGNELTFPKGEEVGESACHVDNSVQVLSSMSVKCCRKDTGRTIIDQTAYKALVPFHLNYTEEYEEVLCLCSVQYMNTCYNSNVSFSFLFNDSSKKWQPLNRRMVIIYIVASYILIILMILLMGTVMFFRKKWGELYTYVYNKLYSAGGYINPGTSNWSSGMYASIRGFAMSRLNSLRRHSQTHDDIGNVDDELSHAYVQNTSVVVYTNASEVITVLENTNDSPEEGGLSHQSSPPPPHLPPREPLLTPGAAVEVTPSMNGHACGTRSSPHRKPPRVCNIRVDDGGYLKPRQPKKRSRVKSSASQARKKKAKTFPRPRAAGCVGPEHEYLELIPNTAGEQPGLDVRGTSSRLPCSAHRKRSTAVDGACARRTPSAFIHCAEFSAK